MNRGSFIKSLFIVAASPKILATIEASPLVETKLNSANLFKDLNYLHADFYKGMIAKYGNQDYLLIMQQLGSNTLK
jgi:hypothetical protein